MAIYITSGIEASLDNECGDCLDEFVERVVVTTQWRKAEEWTDVQDIKWALVSCNFYTRYPIISRCLIKTHKATKCYIKKKSKQKKIKQNSLHI